MRFPNALEGMKKIRTSTILSLCLAVLAALIFFCSMTQSEDVLPLLLIIVLAALVLSITGIILELVGVSRAARDMDSFSSARTALIVGLVISVVSGFFSQDSVLRSVMSLLNSVCSIFATMLILQATVDLAKVSQRPDVAERGQSMLRVVIGLMVAGLVLAVVQLIVPSSAQALNLVLSLAGLALSLLQAFLLLRYYREVIEMLEAGGREAGDESASAGSSHFE
jgi:multisubunit Na+/H+ antiporter MnhG subunit